MESIDNDSGALVLSNGGLPFLAKHIWMPASDSAIKTLNKGYRTQKSDQLDICGAQMMEIRHRCRKTAQNYRNKLN